MSFRTEEKFYIHKDRFVDLRKYLKSKGAYKKYPKRLIKSIYFDNEKLEAYTDSQEGSVLRKKIRIRSYPSEKNKSNHLLECKISSVEGRFKKSNYVNNDLKYKYLKYGYCDPLYGLCKPKVVILYKREYFIFQNKLRVTLDKDIEYYKYNAPLKKIKNNKIVMEVKNTDRVCSNIIINQFPFIKIRFSKFSIAIQNLYNKVY